MPTPKKKSNGSWEATVYIGTDPRSGKKVYKHLTAGTKPELMAKMRRYHDESPETASAASLTVGEAVDLYVERRRSELSPSTLAGYIKMRNTAFPELMRLKISALTDSVCQKAIDEAAKTVSPKTIRNRWNFILSAVREAKKNVSLSVRTPSVRRKRLEMPDTDPLMNLFRAVENTPLDLPVCLAAVCGLRRSEIVALDFDTDIDYERSLIHINKAVVMGPDNKYHQKDTKTDAGERTVPAPAWLIAKIAEARDNPKYVRWQANTITCKFKPLAESCGVNCSFHGLRHYYASVMSALGIPEQYAMERMGHSTNYMLHRYQEYLRSKESEVNNSLMSALENLNPSSPLSNSSQSDNANTTPA